MTNLKRLGAAAVLLFALGLTAFADCPIPGQVEAPPCAMAAQTADDLTPPGQTDGPPAASASAEAVDLVSLSEIALNVLMLFYRFSPARTSPHEAYCQ